MDKKTYIGLFLMLAILLGSSYFLTPKPTSSDKDKMVVKKEAVVPASEVVVSKTNMRDVALLKEPFGALLQGQNKFFYIENNNIKVKVAARGGKVYSVELKKFKDYKGNPVVLFDGEETVFGFDLKLNSGKNIHTNDVYFTALENVAVSDASNPAKLVLRAQNTDKEYIEYVYELKQDSLKCAFDVAFSGLQNVLDERRASLALDWALSLRQQESDIKYERMYSSLYYKAKEGDVDCLNETGDDKEELTEMPTDWVAFKQRFFTSVLINKQGSFEKANLEIKEPKDSSILKHYSANLSLPYNGKVSDNKYGFELLFSNNQFKTLQAQGYDLEKQVKLGWLFLKWINRIAVIPIFNLLDNMGLNYGIIILILTVLLKLVLSPLTYKSYLSMAKMRILKPEMDEIKEKVGDTNPALLQQEYMKLYKQAGVNPLGGCVPLLLQLPITIAFFYFFPNLFELRGKSFLWMHDLSTYDSLITFSPIPLLGWDHLSLMCLLMTISTLIYTYFNNQVSGATGEMKYIGYITPFIFLGVLNSYPSGLNFYYFCANMLTFGQQYLIKKFVDEDKIHAQIQENKKRKNEPKKKSKFQQRMEDYMKASQQKQQKGK